MIGKMKKLKRKQNYQSEAQLLVGSVPWSWKKKFFHAWKPGPRPVRARPGSDVFSLVFFYK